MRSLGWALIQYDWCSYKKKSGNRDRYKEGGDTGARRPSITRQGEQPGGDPSLVALKRKQYLRHLDFEPPAPRTVRQ